jgi:hypothetical protein
VNFEHVQGLLLTDDDSVIESFCRSFYEQQLENSSEKINFYVHDEFDIDTDELTMGQFRDVPLEDFGVTEDPAHNGPTYQVWAVARTYETVSYERPDHVLGPMIPSSRDLTTAEFVIEMYATVTPVFSESFGEITVRHSR